MELIQPTQEQRNKIYSEFETDEEKLQRDVNTLIEWLEKQPHLPNIQDKIWLKHVLLRCKNSVERAKERLDTYYTVRTNMPEIYSDRNPFSKDIETVFSSLTCVPTPLSTPDGCRITIFKVFDSSKSDMIKSDDIIKAIYMSADLRIKIDLCSTDIILFDLGGFTMSVIPLVLLNLRKFLILGTEALPMRFKAFYVINLIPGTETLVTACKNLLKKELSNRIKILRNVEELHQEIPKEILPLEYGGHIAPLEELRDQWLETLRKHQDWFISEHEVKADLTKKPDYTPEKSFGFGTEGSFRQISVD